MWVLQVFVPAQDDLDPFHCPRIMEEHLLFSDVKIHTVIQTSSAQVRGEYHNSSQCDPFYNFK